MDLFGNALDSDAFMDFVAKYVVRRRNELAQDASYLNATAKKRNAEAMGKKYGVDVKDPAALKRKLEEIDALRERWKNPYSDSGLMDEIRAAWRGREGDDAPADAMAGRVETPGERLFREYAAGAWRTVGTDFSVSPTLREDLAAAYEHRLKAFFCTASTEKPNSQLATRRDFLPILCAWSQSPASQTILSQLKILSSVHQEKIQPACLA